MEENSLIRKYVENKLLKFKNSEEYKTIEKVLQDMYPDRWELKFDIIQLDWDVFKLGRYNNTQNLLWRQYSRIDKLKKRMDKLSLQCIIHFPVINIKNRNNSKHIIRDLYVNIQFPLFNKLALVNMDGRRATFTKNEWDTNYGHSHLSGGTSEDKFYDFCMGSSQFGCSRQEEFITKNETKIYQFLFLLQSYLEYESIEGVPYKKIESCIGKSDLKSYTINSGTLMSIISKKPPIKLNKDLKILNREEIEKWLVLNTQCPVAIKIEDTYYSSIGEDAVEEIEEENGMVLFKFKNKYVILKIDNYATEQKETGKVCHPRYTQAVIDYWENRIFQTYITNNRIKREGKIDNTKESIESDKVLMF